MKYLVRFFIVLVVARPLRQQLRIGERSGWISLCLRLYSCYKFRHRLLDLLSVLPSSDRQFFRFEFSLAKDNDVWDPAQFCISNSALKGVVSIVQIGSDPCLLELL